MTRTERVGALLLGLLLGSLGFVAAQRSPVIQDAELRRTFSWGSPEEIRAAIAAGADIEGRYSDQLTAQLCYGIAGGMEPLIQSEHSYTPLMLASVTRGSEQRIEALLELGADVHARTEGGLTALMLASCSASPGEKVRLLLEAGADIEARSVNGWTPLIFASGGPNVVPLGLRATDTVRMLIEAGANLEARTLSGRTALFYAVRMNSLGSVTALLDAGADPNVRDPDGLTPIMFAGRVEGSVLDSRGGSTAVVEALIAAGADVNARNRGGYTALMYAAAFATRDTIEALLRAGADTEARTESGATALLYLFVSRDQEGRLDQMLALVEGGANLEARYPPNGRTILHWLLQYDGTPEEVEALLDAGADPRAVTYDGISVFELAQQNEALRGTSAFWRLNDARFQ